MAYANNSNSARQQHGLLTKEVIIMTNQAYFPNSEAARITWLIHFKTELPIHMPIEGINAEDVTNIIADIDFYTWLLSTWGPTIQKDALEATAYKAMIAAGFSMVLAPVPVHAVFSAPPVVRLPGVLTRVFNFVQRIKISHTYNESIGKDLGIVGVSNNVHHPTPVFSVVTERGMQIERVKLNFFKHQHDGVYIDCRRNTGPWEFIAIAMLKPYYDERALLDSDLSEIREYRLRWWDKSVAHGEWSNIQSVLLGV